MLDAGSVTINPQASGAGPRNQTVSDRDPQVLQANVEPGLDVSKTVSQPNVAAVGNTLTYTIVATNVGNQTLSNVRLNDPMLPTLSCDRTLPTTLTPGSNVRCTAIHTVTQADLDRGFIDNTASGTARAPGALIDNVSDTGQVRVGVLESPRLQLSATPNPGTVNAAETAVDYTVNVTNTGNVALSNLQLDASPALTLTCSPTTIGGRLASGATTTCTATGTLAQADIDRGELSTLFTARGTTPQLAATQTTGSARVGVTQTPAISIDKTASSGPVDAAGATIDYQIVVTNSGNLTLSDVRPVDPKLGALSCTPVSGGSLGPGSTMTCAGSYLVTQTDIDAGALLNTATVRAERPGGASEDPADDIIASDAETVIPSQNPSIDVELTSTVDGYQWAGDPLPYTYTVRNSGNMTLNNVRLTSTTSGVSTPSCTPAQPTSLKPGQTMVCTATKTVSQAEVDAGSLTDTGVVSGTATGNQTVTDASPLTRTATVSNALTLTKKATPARITSSTTPVSYELIVINSGNQTLNAVSITDPLLGTLSCQPDAPATLGPNGRLTCTGSYQPSLADLDAGSVLNAATATGSAPNGEAVNSSVTNVTEVDQTPRLALTKSADPATLTQAGQSVIYTFKATNTGNVTVSNVRIADPIAGLSPLECTPAAGSELTPGQTMSCTATRTPTQAELDAGSVRNTANVTGVGPKGQAVGPVPASSTVTVTQAASLAFTKTVTPTQTPIGASSVDYQFAITNTGNVTVSNIQISDGLPGLGALNCTVDGEPFTLPGTLPPGQTADCTANKPITQANRDAGQIVNTATATGSGANGIIVNPVSSTATVLIAQNPQLSFSQSATPSQVSVVGTQVTRTFTITNQGDVTLRDLRIYNELAALMTVSCDGPVSSLPPGESRICTAIRTVTQEDFDLGSINNFATLRMEGPLGTTDPEDDLVRTADAEVIVTQSPAFTVSKTADATTITAVGQQVNYTIVASNSGNVTLTNSRLSDPLIPELVCPDAGATLAPGARQSCTGSYIVTQDDLDRGELSNTATVEGLDPNGAETTESGSLTIPVTQTPAISISTSADPTNVTGLAEISYSYVVTNTGNVTLSAIEVDDDLAGVSAIDCPDAPAQLAPGESLSCTASRTMTQLDLDAGSVTNSAKVTASPPAGGSITDEDSVRVSVTPQPGLTLDKTAMFKGESVANQQQIVAAKGDTIEYLVKATNHGNVTLSQVQITDTMLGRESLQCHVDDESVTMPEVVLAPGQTLECRGDYLVTQANLDGGYISNTAAVEARTPAGAAAPTATDGIQLKPVQSPAIEIVKTANPTQVSAVNEVVTYTFTATNTGNVTLGGVVLADPMEGLSPATCTSSYVLAPGDKKICTATRVVTQADLNAGSFDNTANVRAEKPGGNPAILDDDLVAKSNTVSVTATQNPAITLTKRASVDDYSRAGEVIDYSFTVRNSGNVDLTDLQLSDPKIETIVCPELPGDVLPAGASTICTGSYTVTQADADAPSLSNEAHASALPPGDMTPRVSASDTETLPKVATPDLDLRKQVNATSYRQADEILEYTLTATNGGSTTLTGVQISDALSGLGTLACTVDGGAVTQPVALAPEAQLVCKASYTIQQGDIDAGQLVNAAKVTGTSEGVELTDTASVRILAQRDPKISMTKQASVEKFSAAGTQIDYTITVTNSGNVTLDRLEVKDPLLSSEPLGCQATRLAPGDSTTCEASLTTTQAHVDDGGVSNTATATAYDGQTAVNAVASHRVAAERTASFTLAASSNPTSYDHAGEVVELIFTATNTGTVTLGNVYFNDTIPLSQLTPFQCVVTQGGEVLEGAGLQDLTPGQTKSCTTSYVIKQIDIDRGYLESPVWARPSAPAGLAVDRQDSVHLLTADQDAELVLTKVADHRTYSAVGQITKYTLTATNTGNVTLTNPKVTDELLGTLSCPAIDGLPAGESFQLAPGGSVTCTGERKITQLNLDAGTVVNTAEAYASYTDRESNEVRVDAEQASWTSTAIQNSSLLVEKTANAPSITGANQPITFTVSIRNNGNVTLTGLTIEDSLPGLSEWSDWSCSAADPSSIAPGANISCTASYLTTQVDADNRDGLVNRARVSANAPGQTEQISASDYVALSAAASSAFTLDKTATVAGSDGEPKLTPTVAGDVVSYTFDVHNTGALTIEGITISDPMLGVALSHCKFDLAPDAKRQCEADYVVQQSDVNAGMLTNSAQAAGLDSHGGRPTATDVVELTIAPVFATEFSKTTETTSVNSLQEVTYQLSFVNDSNITLEQVVITDPGADLTCPTTGTDLAPGERLECEATRLVTQDQLDAGSVLNTATTTYHTQTDRTDRTVTASAAVSVAQDSSGVTFTKTADRARVEAADDDIVYEFVVYNGGNVTISDVRISDEMDDLGTLVCSPAQGAELAPGASMRCTATKRVSAADMDLATLDNVATMTAKLPLPSGEPASDQLRLTDSAQVIPVHTPALSLAKVAQVQGEDGSSKTQMSAVGDVITYTFTARNTGNAVLDDVRLIDDMPGLDFVDGCALLTGVTLAVGEQARCDASRVVTQADLDAPTEKLGNSARLTASDRNSDPITLNGQPIDEADPVIANVTADVQPKLELTKSSATTLIGGLGEVVPYQFTVTNSGNVTVSEINLVEQLVGVRDVDCGTMPFTLTPSQSRNCTARYTVTQDDMDAGTVDNLAEVTGKRPSGAALTDAERATAKLSIPTDSQAELSVSKKATVDQVDAIGDIIGYTITITNTGNVTLRNVTPDDGMPGLFAKNCPGVDKIPVAALAPGASFTCTASYRAVAADFDARQITNTARAFADDPDGIQVSAESDAIKVTANSHPSATISKTADVSSVSQAGDQITYTVQVRNTGNVTINELSITDSMPGLSLACGTDQSPPPTSLAAGRSLICQATHTVTQAEIDAGTIINTATLGGTTVAGPLSDGKQSTAVVDALRSSDLKLTKRASVATVDNVGDLIDYTFTLTNAGNTTLTNVELIDDFPFTEGFVDQENCPDWLVNDTLTPGQSVSCTASYETTHADLERGIITNTAHARADSPNGGAAGRMAPAAPAGQVTALASASVVAIYNPALSLEMAIVGPENWMAGDVLSFRYTVTNIGSLDAHKVLVADPLGGLAAIDCPATMLPKGESMVCEASYKVTQSDADSGRLTSTATLDANEFTGEPFRQQTANALTTTDLQPAMVLDKTADVTEVSQVGDIIKYSFTGTNTGKVTISGGSLVDDLPGLYNQYCPPDPLIGPGETHTCTAEYAVTQADLDAGSIINTATMVATDLLGRAAEASTDSWTVSVLQTPKLRLEGSPDQAEATSPSERISYSITLTNDGNVTLNSVTVRPTRAGMVLSGCFPQPLAPGESRSCELSWVVTQDDMDSGEVVAGVAANALAPGGSAVVADEVDLTIPASQRPVITLSKNADRSLVDQPGTEVGYTLLLRNQGNVTLYNVLLSDDLADMSGLSCEQPMTLRPNEVRSCTVSYEVAQGVFDTGMVTSISEVTASTLDGALQVADDARMDIPVVLDPVLIVSKRADRDVLTHPGELLNYLFIVTNVGNTSLPNIILNDPMPGLTTVACDRYDLAPGDSAYCQAGYPVTQADIDAGELANTVTVTALAADGTLRQSQATSRVPVVQRPELRLQLVASTSQVSEPGQTIRYSFVALNTGNVTASEVEVVSALAGISDLSCSQSGPVALAPGEVLSCQASYQATAEDFAVGRVVNQAVVRGHDPIGLAIEPASATSTVTAYSDPIIRVVKQADVVSVGAVGETIDYTFTVRNVGLQRLDQVQLVDPMPGLSEIICDDGPLSSLEPGAQAVCRASYTVTQADLEGIAITNLATVSAIGRDGVPVDDRTLDSAVGVVPTQKISLVKTSDPQVVGDVGATVTYTFTLTNESSQTVTNPTIRDDMPGLYDWDCPDAGLPLAPGAQRVCTAKFDIVRPIFESGSVYNLATAYAYSAFGAPLATSAYNLLTFESSAGLAVTKTADRAEVAGVDEPITYTITAQNTGNETINAVRVIDPMLAEVSCEAEGGRLAPGETITCTGIGYASQAQLDAGVVPNTVVVTGEAASGDVFDPSDDVIGSDSVEIAALARPGAGLRVLPQTDQVNSGEVVRFMLELTNTGNLTLTEFDWVFSRPVSTVVCETDEPLAPGQTRSCWIDYVATPQDAAAGSALLSVTVTGRTARPGVGFGPVDASGIVQVLSREEPEEPVLPSEPVPPSEPTRPSVRPKPVSHDDKPGRLPRTGGLGAVSSSIVEEE